MPTNQQRIDRMSEENPVIRFVVATRQSEQDFHTGTALGKSLSLYPFPLIEIDLYPRNVRGLPAVYNLSIEKAREKPAILVFAHDDIYLTDFFWINSIQNALRHFEIAGLAGNRRRVPGQPAWGFIDEDLTWDRPEFLSGVVGHGFGFPPSDLSFFGAPGQEVKLLDGLLLISRSETLIKHNLRFDEIFDFHFYDMDFCRSAEAKGVRMGTWPLSVVHESDGHFGSDSWRSALKKYRQKWGS